MIKSRVRALLADFPSLGRVYEGYRTVRWWARRRRSVLAWTETYLPVSSHLEPDIPRPFPDVARSITAELGRPLDHVFRRIDPEPLACATLAQVHRAQLKDGRPVAVKVPHAGVEKTVRADTRILGSLLRLLARLEPTFDFRPVIDELVRAAQQDLDYTNEGRNAERVAEGFGGREDVIIPAVHWQYTTPGLLVTDFVEGIPVTYVDDLRAAGIDPAAVSRLVADVYCRQLCLNDTIHADPHPGNILVQPGPRVALVDFGLCLPLDRGFRLAFARLIKAMTDRDPVALLPAFEQLGIHTRGGGDQSSVLVLAHVFTDLLRLGGYPRRGFRVEADSRIARAVREDPITEIPAELLLILRAIGLLGWLTSYLGSPVDLLEALRPYTRTALAQAA